MPYGTVSKYQPNLSVVFTNVTPTSSKDYNAGTWANTFPAHSHLNFTRSGTNANGRKGISLKSPPGTFERVVVSVPKGPRLPYKVWSRRLKKYVWARQPIYVFKLRRVKSKQKPSKGLDLPPNNLSFEAGRVSYFGGDGTGNGTILLISNTDPAYSRKYTGALWAGFAQNGGSSVVGPNPQNYTGSAVSSRFTSALAELAPSALTKLYSEVKNQKVNFAQAIAERTQTSGLILDLTSRLVRAVSAARHGNLAKAAGVLFPRNSKQLANDWLVYQYGVRPLISDIKGCINLLQDEPEQTFDVVVSRTKKLPRECLITETNMNGACVTKVYSEGYATVKYKVRVKVSDPFGRFMSETGFSDVSLLAWELCPYSFVIDWLIPVGNYLQNHGAFANLEIVHFHKTEFCKELITYERQFLSGKSTVGYKMYGDSAYGFVNERVRCSRKVITTGMPKLPYPSFKDPASLGHILNSIALLRQLKH